MTPRIYVADLAAYNAGTLHGIWIDATKDIDDIWKDIHAMLKASPEPFAEEYAIHDYEDFHPIRISEYQGIESAHEIATFIEEHGALGAAVMDQLNDDLEAAKTALEEDYCGEYQSASDFAAQLTEETTEIPPSLQYYIDYDAMARDMELNGDIFTVETGYEEVHIFWNR